MEKMDHLNISSIAARIKSETPRFWKMVRRYMITCSGLGVALMAAKSQYEMEWLPERVCEYLVVIGAIGTALASLTATDHYEAAPPQDQNQQASQ